MVSGFGFKVKGVGCGVWDLGAWTRMASAIPKTNSGRRRGGKSRAQASGFMLTEIPRINSNGRQRGLGLRFMVYGLGCRFERFGFRGGGV